MTLQKTNASLHASVNTIFETFNLIQMEALKTLHKPARLVIPSNNKRWYIILYIYDVQSGQVQRKRFYGIPEEENNAKRIFNANTICYELNKKLATGYISDKTKYQQSKIAEQNDNNPVIYLLRVSVAIMRVVEAKRYNEQRTYQSYFSIAKSLCQYLDTLNPEPDVDHFGQEIALAYLQSLLHQGKAPRTYNNHLLTLRTLWQEGMELKYFKSNPFKSIPRVKTPLGKNIAYLPAQQQEIISYAKKYPEMLFLIRFMYYTLARTNEIGHLKVKHIGMYTPDKIYLPASVSKNNIERHIVIPPGLEKEIEKFNIRKMDPEWYIFSRDKFKCGPLRMDTRRIGQKYREWITSKLDYPVVYTLYSWKHTGIIAAHKAGISDDDIMMQTGHKDYGSFQKYLKSLGLYDNKDFALKMPDI
jgi:integrase